MIASYGMTLLYPEATAPSAQTQRAARRLVRMGRTGFLLAVGAIGVAALARLVEGGNTVALIGALAAIAATAFIGVMAAAAYVRTLTIEPLEVPLTILRGVV